MHWTKVADRLPPDRAVVAIALMVPKEGPATSYDVATFHAHHDEGGPAWERAPGWFYRDVNHYILAWAPFERYRP